MDALGLVARELLGEAIVELGGVGRLVAGDAGGDLKFAAFSPVLGDPDAAEAVGAVFAGQAGARGTALDYLEGGGAGYRLDK